MAGQENLMSKPTTSQMGVSHGPWTPRNPNPIIKWGIAKSGVPLLTRKKPMTSSRRYSVATVTSRKERRTYSLTTDVRKRLLRRRVDRRIPPQTSVAQESGAMEAIKSVIIRNRILIRALLANILEYKIRAMISINKCRWIVRCRYLTTSLIFRKEMKTSKLLTEADVSSRNEETHPRMLEGLCRRTCGLIVSTTVSLMKCLMLKLLEEISRCKGDTFLWMRMTDFYRMRTLSSGNGLWLVLLTHQT